MRRLKETANRLIEPTENRKKVFYTDADVKDIIKVILYADSLSLQFVKRFAFSLRGRTEKQTLKNIWSFVRKYIEYKKDNSGDEIIKSPGKTWNDKTADCKSMSVMVGSLLKSLNFDYYYKVAFYDSKEPEQGHIYPVAIMKNGENVVVDAVHFVFNEEIPYWKADNYDPDTGEKRENVAAVAGINKNESILPVAIITAIAIGAFYLRNRNDKSKLHTRCEGLS